MSQLEKLSFLVETNDYMENVTIIPRLQILTPLMGNTIECIVEEFDLPPILLSI